jgi:hypothetical protein
LNFLYLAEDLVNSIVLVGDCADEDLLREENIDETDVYCALTNDDEANILSAMLAKRMGCQRVMSLINRPAYADLVEGSSIDIAISPQQITLGALPIPPRACDLPARAQRRSADQEFSEAGWQAGQRESLICRRL